MRLSAAPKSFLEKRLGIIKWLQCSDVLFHVNQEGIELWRRELQTRCNILLKKALLHAFAKILNLLISFTFGWKFIRSLAFPSMLFQAFLYCSMSLHAHACPNMSIPRPSMLNVYPYPLQCPSSPIHAHPRPCPSMPLHYLSL